MKVSEKFLSIGGSPKRKRKEKHFAVLSTIRIQDEISTTKQYIIPSFEIEQDKTCLHQVSLLQQRTLTKNKHSREKIHKFLQNNEPS